MGTVISYVPCVVPLDVVFSRFEGLNHDQAPPKVVVATARGKMVFPLRRRRGRPKKVNRGRKRLELEEVIYEDMELLLVSEVSSGGAEDFADGGLFDRALHAIEVGE